MLRNNIFCFRLTAGRANGREEPNAKQDRNLIDFEVIDVSLSSVSNALVHNQTPLVVVRLGPGDGRYGPATVRR
jgi:hypothetical protein